MRNNRGQVLPLVLIILAILLVMVPAMTYWLQADTNQTVQQQRSTVAFNLAEAGVDKALWKLKTSTKTWEDAASGTPIAGFDNDAVYTDIAGGAYRIRFSSGPGAHRVTVTAEGRDASTNEKRAIKARFRNMNLPGAIITGGMVEWKNGLSAHWGPVMAHDDITISDNNAAKDYFPRKYSRQVVRGTGPNPRDLNGLTPPNTDNVEWWSDYDVPDLPILDFKALKQSAIASGTYNVYGCKKAGATWITPSSCSNPHTYHFGDPANHGQAKNQRVYYWDGDVELKGNCGIYGTVICRGNLTISADSNYGYDGHVPSEAWEEYTKICDKSGIQWDTTASDEYPADGGLRTSKAVFRFGTDSWTVAPNPNPNNTYVAIRGFVYCGGNFNCKTGVNIHGAVWVANDVEKTAGQTCYVFFDDTLKIPVLNVVLKREQWDEVLPSTENW